MPPLPGLHLVSGVDERRRSGVRVHCVLSGFGVLGVGMSMYIHVLYLVVLLLVLCIAAQAMFSSVPSQALNSPYPVFPWFLP